MSSKITRVFTSVFIVFIVMFSILLVSAQQETMLNDIFKSGSYKSIYIPDTAKISRDEFMSIIGSAQKNMFILENTARKFAMYLLMTLALTSKNF